MPEVVTDQFPITFTAKDSLIKGGSKLAIGDVITLTVTAKVVSQALLQDKSGVETRYEIESGTVTKRGRSLRAAVEKSEKDAGNVLPSASSPY